jgi:hypothetical protein
MDAPYEHNAGTPYAYSEQSERDRGLGPWTITRVAFDGPFETPCDHHTNSPFSVEQINAGAVAWLRTARWCKEPLVIPAGTTLSEFVRLIEKAGGTVYAEVHANG